MTQYHHPKYQTKSALSDQEKFHFVRLCRTPKITSSLFFRLLNVFRSPKLAIENLEDFSSKFKSQQSIKPIAEAIIKKEFENCFKLKASIITFQDNQYPHLLREISDPPPFLTVKGNAKLLNENIISIVGTRNSSFNGNKIAKDISLGLGENNFIIASGMARGIDTAAHIGALKEGTIAVLAGGIDNIYPRENQKLYQKICEGGLVISEMPCGFIPRQHSFPQRNRIISGISLAVAVIEATINSGTLITARFAVEQNRDLFSVPGSPLDPRCRGSNNLLKQGAFMLQNHLDIVNEVKKPVKKNILNFAENNQSFSSENFKIPNDDCLKEATKIIINQINFTPIAIEEIIKQCDEVPIRIINIVLTQLELADKIENIRGKISLKIG